MDHVGGIADQREALGDEGARHRKAERIGPARADRRDLAEMQAEAALELGMKLRIGQRNDALGLGACSVQTIDERRPFSGRIANGPDGRKCSSARP